MKNRGRNAHSADAAQGTLERACPCRNADSARAGRPQGAMARYGSRSPFKPIRQSHLRDGVPCLDPQVSAGTATYRSGVALVQKSAFWTRRENMRASEPPCWCLLTATARDPPAWSE